MLAASNAQLREFNKRRNRGRGSSWADDEELDEMVAVKIESDDELSSGSTTVDDASSKRLSDSSEDGTCAQTSSEEESPTAAAAVPVAFMPQAGSFAAMPMMAPMAGGMPMAPQFYMMTMTPNGQQMMVPVMAAGMPTAMPFCGMAMMPMQQATDTKAGELENRAAALKVHAQEVTAAAKRAKAAVQAARNAGKNAASKAATTENAKGEEHQSGADQRTTLMFRNLPNSYTRSKVSDMLDKEGLNGAYCFIYVPTDFKKFTSFGYAFVGFTSHAEALRAKQHFQGFNAWDSDNVCDVAWSGPVQGLEQHTERYRNSPVMHPSVPDEYKPAVFVNGERAEFPAPTKRIRPPRLRHGISGDVLVLGEQAA